MENWDYDVIYECALVYFGTLPRSKSVVKWGFGTDFINVHRRYALIFHATICSKNSANQNTQGNLERPILEWITNLLLIHPGQN